VTGTEDIFRSFGVKKPLQQDYAGYLVSEAGVFLGIVYILIAVIFWKSQMKKQAVENLTD